MTPPLDECCFKCIECHNVRCLEDGDRGCIHGQPICDRCYPGDCPECQEEAERRMHETGDYDPRADPLYDHTVPRPVDRIARDGGYRWEGVWVPVEKP